MTTKRNERRLAAAALAVALALAGPTVTQRASARVTSAQPAASTSPPATPSPSPSPTEAPPEQREPAFRTYVAWSPAGLPKRVECHLDARAGIDASTAWSGLEWMRGAVRSGTRRARPRRGYAFPLETLYVEPAEYARFVPQTWRGDVRRLAAERVLVGETSAALRGDRRGDRLRLTVDRVRVDGVVPDHVTQGYELLRTAHNAPTAAKRMVLVRARTWVAPRRVRRLVRRAVRSEVPVQTVSDRQTRFLRYAGSSVRAWGYIKKRFGEFSARPTSAASLDIDPAWTESNIVVARVPILGTVRCNRRFVPVLRRALSDVQERGLEHTVNAEDYAGCFAPRFVATAVGARISRHAWGAAVDINARANPYGAEPRQDPRLVRIMESWGFVWGGSWLVPDGMHFEWFRNP